MEDNTKNEEFDVVIEDEPTADTEDTATEVEPEIEEVEPKNEEKTVPLTALQKEREKTRQLKKDYAEQKKVLERIMQGAGAHDPKDLETRMDDLTLKNYIEQQGMDENTARLFLMQQKKLTELERSKGDISFKEEISQMKDNPFYADIDEVSEDVIDYAKSKGLTAKEAYNALYGEQRAMEMQKEKAAAAIDEKKKDTKIAALSSAGNAPANKNTVKLTSEEATWAKAAGMTPEEYAKYKKMN